MISPQDSAGPAGHLDMSTTIPAPPPSAPPSFDPNAAAWLGFGELGYDDYLRAVLAAQGLSPMDLK